VVSQPESDVIEVQNVLRRFEADGDGALGQLSDESNLNLAFAMPHRRPRGQLGDAILSRFSILAISIINISQSRVEHQGGLAAAW
jgi:endonuclease/exonuclease/phosphatase family metal-dependent hydrolase